MKTIKKVVAVLVAAVMVMAMGITAFAEEATVAAGKGSLTVRVKKDNSNSLLGQTLKLYKLFDLTVSGESGNEKYGYTVNPVYKDILKKVLNLDDTAEDIEYYNAINQKTDAADIKKFAEDLSKEVLIGGESATVEATDIQAEKEYTFSDLDYGYYLVYQTGTSELQSSLTSVWKENNEISLKGSTPTIVKTATPETVEIGEIVTYTVKGKIPNTTGYQDYVYKIHDKLSTGLDFTDVDGVKPSDNNYNVSVTIAGGQPENLTAILSGADKRTMTLELSQWVQTKQDQVGKEFTVTYYAKVNKAAVVTEQNEAKLEFGNEPNHTTMTKPSVAKTPTYPLNINKTNEKNTILPGATFRLFKNLEDANKNQNAIKFDGVEGKYTVAENKTSGNEDVVSGATNVGNGYNLQLNGLKAGDYYLVETKAPDGYNKVSAPIKITITKSTTEDVNGWTLTAEGADVEGNILKVINKAGALLPETGGMGTILFTVIAVILIAGVAISFVVSRRKER